MGGRAVGFAGTPDLYAASIDSGKYFRFLKLDRPAGIPDRVELLEDLKTTVNVNKSGMPYDKWKIQLGAYSILRGTDTAVCCQTVADRETGEVRFINHADPEKWIRYFQYCFEQWVILKGYDPRECE